jgi:purine-nucleoside phosphorylase
MSENTVYQKIQSASNLIQKQVKGTPLEKPKIGIILGSGLGKVAEILTDTVTIHYKDIPHFHGTSVEGHEGKLLLGLYQNIPVVILQGRFHYYEGYPMDEVVFPTRTICALGIHTLILTNAAGGINTRYKPCDLMIIEDHINLMGDNPLKGPNLAELGPRFPDMTDAYHKAATQSLIEAATELKLPIQKGVYAGLVGPTYETPAEIRMLRILGADAVGMSTVPESIAANHLGVRVCGISCITNLAAGISGQKLMHEEVIDSSKTTANHLTNLMKLALPRLMQIKKST